MDDEMLMDREEAERFPCTYKLPGGPPRIRSESERGDSSWRCGAQVGEPCRDPRTDRVLERQAAHLVRLRAAGRAPEPAPPNASAPASTSAS